MKLRNTMQQMQSRTHMLKCYAERKLSPAIQRLMILRVLR